MCDLNSTTLLIIACWFKESPWWSFADGIVTILSALIIIYGAFKLLHWWNSIKLRCHNNIFPKNTIVVFGIGKNNRTYINSEIEAKQHTIIIVDNDKNNLYVKNYMGTNNVSVKIADATNKKSLESLKLNTKKHIVVSLGNDMTNLEVVTQVLEIAPEAKIYVHIEDRNLRLFHKEGGLLEGKNIKVYSYYEDTSRALFNEHDIDGKSTKIIQSNVPYSIAVVGNTNLAYEVISQACIIGQLPNENKLTIYCIDKNPKEFKQSVDLNYTKIDNVPNVEFKYIELDCNSKQFYKEEFWHEENLTNIILCFEDEQVNIDIAANLANITYLEQIADKNLSTKVLIGMFNDYNFSEKLKANSSTFKNFYVFGQRHEISDKKYLIAEERDKLAKEYNNRYNKLQKEEIENKRSQITSKTDQEKINKLQKAIRKNENNIKEWEERSYLEKESNRALADHIIIKQKYLKHIDSSEHAVNSILSKCEHNRWMSFHYLNGYVYSNDRNHNKKKHKCLIPFEELDLDNKKSDAEMVKLAKELMDE